MTSVTLATPGGAYGPARALARVGTRVIAALRNDATANRTMLVLVVLYALSWALYGTITKFGEYLQGDMAELFAWSLEPLQRGHRHPPFLTWVVKAWFTVWPVAPWSYYLLAGCNLGLALYCVWLATGHFVDRRRQVLATALLCLNPIYSMHALDLNHNTILVSVWAAAGLTFIWSIERRNLLWSILFGIVVGLAVLAKHFSVFLLGGLALASLAHPHWRSYYRSPRPYLAAMAAVAVVTPHLFWLLSQDLAPVTRNVTRYQADSLASLTRHAVSYLGAAAAYNIPGVLLLMLALGRAHVMQTVRFAPDPDGRRRVAAVMLLGPLLLSILGLGVLRIRVHDPWVFPMLNFFPLLMLMLWPASLPWAAVRRILGVVAVYTAALLALSPVIMAVLYYIGTSHNEEPGVEFAREVTRLWRDRTGLPLRIVVGNRRLTNLTSFYSPDHPYSILISEPNPAPWIDADRLLRKGSVIVCMSTDAYCMKFASDTVPNAERVSLTMTSRFLGMARPSVTYVVTIRPPVP